MREYAEAGRKIPRKLCKEWSVHSEPNPLWNLPGFNPCKNPSCRMHACDHGTFKRILDLTTAVISSRSSAIKRQFDDRWSQLLRFPGVRVLHKGVLTLKYIRAHEHRCIAMGLPYVLEGLIPGSVAQQCSVAYNEWRLELNAEVYQKATLTRANAMSGLGSLTTLAAMGGKLQRLMNQLNAEVNELKRQSKRKRDDHGASASEQSDKGDEDGCNEEDMVYTRSGNAVIPENDDIHGNHNLKLSQQLQHHTYSYIRFLQVQSSFTK